MLRYHTTGDGILTALQLVATMLKSGKPLSELAAWAEEMGHRDVIALFKRTLDEEKATDAKLTQIAESRLNRRAAA